MSLPEPGQRVLILHDLGGFTPATFDGVSPTHGSAWGRVSIAKTKQTLATRHEPLSHLALDTPANRAAALQSLELFESGLSSIEASRSIAATLPRLETAPGRRPMRRRS